MVHSARLATRAGPVAAVPAPPPPPQSASAAAQTGGVDQRAPLRASADPSGTAPPPAHAATTAPARAPAASLDATAQGVRRGTKTRPSARRVASARVGTGASQRAPSAPAWPGGRGSATRAAVVCATRSTPALAASWTCAQHITRTTPCGFPLLGQFPLQPFWSVFVSCGRRSTRFDGRTCARVRQPPRHAMVAAC